MIILEINGKDLSACKRYLSYKIISGWAKAEPELLFILSLLFSLHFLLKKGPKGRIRESVFLATLREIWVGHTQGFKMSPDLIQLLNVPNSSQILSCAMADYGCAMYQ